MRELRAKLQDLDALDKRFDEMRGYVVHALGLGSMSDMKGRKLEARMEAGEAHSRRVDERFSDIERRLSKVEEKVDD